MVMSSSLGLVTSLDRNHILSNLKETAFIYNTRAVSARLLVRDVGPKARIKVCSSKPGYPDGHSHQLRGTAAAEWLTAGLPMGEVTAARALLHQDNEKHYAPSVKSRQDRLDHLVTAT
jgi:hypothetical protein